MTTVAYGDYDPRSRLLRYANAGHMPFILRTEHETTFLWDGRSPPLGLAPNERIYAELTVPEASQLVGFTDGLVERPGESIDVGLAKLAELIDELPRGLGVDAWCDSTIARLVGPDARDDTVLLCIRFDDDPA
jgi:serine phosphatase RsbU (regulator of sigma subunit)